MSQIKFKKYPENKPSFAGANYLCIIDVAGDICFAFRRFSKLDFVFSTELHKETILAFTETDPKTIAFEV